MALVEAGRGVPSTKGVRAGRRRKSRTEETRTPHRRSPRFRPRTQPPRTPHRRRMTNGTRHHTTSREYHEHEASQAREPAHRGTYNQMGGGDRRKGVPAMQRPVGGEEAFRTEANPPAGRGVGVRPTTCNSKETGRSREGTKTRQTKIDSVSGEGGGGGGARNGSPSLPSHTMPKPRGLGPSIQAPSSRAPSCRIDGPGQNTGHRRRPPRKPRSQREETHRLICVRPLDCTLRQP